MNSLKAKVAYLQGLSNGLEEAPASKEGKLLKEIINTLDEFADSVGDLEGYVESIDEDLQYLEDEIYENGAAGSDDLEVECPRCGETVCFDSAILEDDDLIEVTCPECNEVVFTNDGDSSLKNMPAVIEGEVGTGRALNTTEEDI